MKIEQLPKIFNPARPILQRLEKAGYEAYFVGGCVRDTLLGDEIHDIDIATSAYPQEVKSLFDHTVDTGIEHGTVMVLANHQSFEITTFRTESGYQDYRRPDKVTFVRSLKEDLKRRDFTINALAMKENGEVIDEFDGLGDLKKQLIRAVGDPDTRFHEDALRMMRAVRFASRLNFKIDDATVKGISDNASLLTKIAVERIQVEMQKLLLGQNVSAGLSVMLKTNLYKYCPGLANYKNELGQLVLSNRWPLDNPTQAWSTLAVALYLQSDQLVKFLRGWKLSNKLIDDVKKVVPAVTSIKRRSFTREEMFNAGQRGLYDANRVATIFNWNMMQSELDSAYQHLPLKYKKELAINGSDLLESQVVKPGPEMGKLLHDLEVKVLYGKLPNNHDKLLEYVKKERGQQ